MADAVDVQIARLEERLAAMDRATVLQAAEYERRLHSLNGEAGRIREVLSLSVSREAFEQYVRGEAKSREAFEDTYRREHVILADRVTGQEVSSREAGRISDVQDRHTQRNIGWLGLGIAVLVVIVNVVFFLAAHS